MYIFIIFIVICTLLFAYYNHRKVQARDPGNPLMQELARLIAEGALTFLHLEIKILVVVSLIIASLLALIVAWYVGAAFLIGAIFSGAAGYLGMKSATITNVRVTNEARTTFNVTSTLKVAFQGGSVMGLLVAGFALAGLLLVFFFFGLLLGQLDINNLIITTNHLGISFIPFTMSISGYALGCSVVAMFNRVGGGIYTKAADMGADLVGKAETHLPEDDARNPATIADNVGDNVGDVAGLGSDLLESFVGAIVAAMTLASYMFATSLNQQHPISATLTLKLINYPLLFVSIGLLASMLGIGILLKKKPGPKPQKELNKAVSWSALLTILLNGVVTYYFFHSLDISSIGFKFGTLSPFLAAVSGIISGLVIGLLAEYYTSYDYQPTRKLAEISLEGPALIITRGMSIGLRSTFFPVAVLGITIIVAYSLAGIYGVTMAAVGMLSFVAATVAVDTYGPIADNAGGISEMAKLPSTVRNITDQLDSIGNTTAAIGKGFAIGSAALAALSLLVSYIQAQGHLSGQLNLNIIEPLTLVGAMLGAALPFLFSGILIDAVTKVADQMVTEIRYQFRLEPKIITGEIPPDYHRCISISSLGALKEMVTPSLIAVVIPLISGFIFGPQFVGGLLIGTTLSAIMLAIYTANAGGAWDNAKKYIEIGGLANEAAGTPAHEASIIGDTVGDPLKDTVGPSLDILIKIMAVISLIGVSIFSRFFIFGFFK